MNSRRKFLLQGSLVATAVIALKPLSSLAKYSSPVTGNISHFNNITFLHTNGTGLAVSREVKKMATKSASIVLQHCSTQVPGKEYRQFYDATMSELHDDLRDGFKIVNKDGMRVGIISVRANDQDAINRINDLSLFLKKEKDCRLVICLSELGFKNKNTLDDITLANKSEHLDIIVGKFGTNSPGQPVITRNRIKAEVIVQHTEESSDAIGKIKIGFNRSGEKHHVSF